MNRPDLHLDFVGRDAVAFACHRWHYSRSVPASKVIGIGVWEGGGSFIGANGFSFIGALTFSRGNTPNIAQPFGRTQAEVCELTRVALSAHVTPTSRILAIALRLLQRQSPGLKLVVSYSDPQHGHDGRGVYASSNWLYLGLTHPEAVLRVHGRLLHPRTVGSRYGHRGIAWLRAHVDAHAERIVTVPKHKYVFPFDSDLRARLVPLVRPYPTRDRSTDSGARGPHAGDSPSGPGGGTTREGALRNDPVAPLLHEGAHV